MGHQHSHDRPSRRRFLGSTAAAGASVPLSGLAWVALPELSQDMAKAARAWLSALTAAQLQRARLDWSDPLRTSWHYVPRSRPGIALREMSAAQMAAAWDLISSLLSARGLEQVRAQLMLERTLGELTRRPSAIPATTRWCCSAIRPPRALGLALRGPPPFADHGRRARAWRGDDAGLLRRQSSHVPARHAHAGFRLLGAEEDAAFGLIRSLEGSARGRR